MLNKTTDENKENNSARTNEMYKSSYSFKPRPSAMEESIKMRKAKKAGKLAFVLVLFVVLLFIALTVTVQIFFKVETIRVEGNVFYSEEEIISRSGIENGSNLFSISISSTKKAILGKLNGVSDVKIHRNLPSEVVIEVVEHIPSMYVTVGNNNYILSSGMLVLENSEIEGFNSDGLVKVILPSITGCIAGQRIKSNDIDSVKLVEELYAELKNKDMLTLTDEINMTDKFNITVKYDSDFTIKLGNALKLEAKLSMAKQIMENAEKRYGTIDVSADDVSKGIHTW